MQRKPKPGDVHWFVPGRKRPIAYSTKATSDLIGYLAADGLTFTEAHAAIRFDDEVKAVVQCYIDRGFGDRRMSDLGVR